MQKKKKDKLKCAVPTVAIFAFHCHCFAVRFLHSINFINFLSHISSGSVIIHNFERNPNLKRDLCAAEDPSEELT